MLKIQSSRKLFTYSLIGVFVPSFFLISANLYFTKFKNFWCSNDFVVGLISWKEADNDFTKESDLISETSCSTILHDQFFQAERDTRKVDYIENKQGVVTSVTPTLPWRTEKLPVVSQDKKQEALHSLKAAILLKTNGKLAKARRVLEHAHTLDPLSPDILTELGEVVEKEKGDVLLAEYYYHKAVRYSPSHRKALQLRASAFPIVQDIDQGSIRRVDSKLRAFYELPEDSPELRSIKRDQYFSHIYHSNAIEGNTLSLSQTRSILETRIAIGGKSILEQNEVLGLDAALKYINNSLLRTSNPITVEHILQIHRRVLGFVDLSEAGNLRQTQVYIANHTPPPSRELPRLMEEFVAWLNSAPVRQLHGVERAALAHWYLVNIHPFYDGNGRTARLLMNALLMRAGYPPAIIRVEDRAQYFEYIQRANDGDVRWFIRFIVRATELSLDELLQCLTKSSTTADDEVNKENVLNQTLSNISAMSAPVKRNCNVYENDEGDSMLSPPRVIYLEGA